MANVTVYEVPGISCGHCKHAIESAVSGVPGVVAADVEIATRRLRVEGSPDRAAVVAAVAEAGYEGMREAP